MPMYYSNGGPGPADKLLRVDAPPDGDHRRWQQAQGWRWTVTHGWFREPAAQNMIQNTGDFFVVDESQVAGIQKQMREDWAKP